MEWKDKIAGYVVENGPSLLGAIFVILAGLIAARWIGKFAGRWLSRREMEPPLRMFITRVIKLTQTFPPRSRWFAKS